MTAPGGSSPAPSIIDLSLRQKIETCSKPRHLLTCTPRPRRKFEAFHHPRSAVSIDSAEHPPRLRLKLRPGETSDLASFRKWTVKSRDGKKAWVCAHGASRKAFSSTTRNRSHVAYPCKVVPPSVLNGLRAISINPAHSDSALSSSCYRATTASSSRKTQSSLDGTRVAGSS